MRATKMESIGFVLAVSASAVAGPSASGKAPGAHDGAQLLAASVAVPADNDCVLHPKGNADPNETIPVRVDEDGVARFFVVPPTTPNDVDQLALDCIDSKGKRSTYAVDLRSKDTFAARPFDAVRAGLAVRAALTGDPLKLTREQLLNAGYGLRPDPTLAPEGYKRWLEAARIPVHRLHGAVGVRPAASQSGPTNGRTLDVRVHKDPSVGWTGAVLVGSYKKKATSAETESYGATLVSFNVPNVLAGPTAAATIWNGLDNVLQGLVDVNTCSWGASFDIHHQNFNPTTTKKDDEAGTRFTPNPGDTIYDAAYYCDAEGNLDLSGGYACTYMIDETQNLGWDCVKAKSSECTSYKLKPGDLGNGKLGFQADFIIEDEGKEWPQFSPVTMMGDALVVKGNGASQKEIKEIREVSTNNDPNVKMYTDKNPSHRHLIITLPGIRPGDAGVRWGQIVCPSDAQWKPASNACVCNKASQKFIDGKCQNKK